MTNYENNLLVERPARVTANRDLVTMPDLYKWVAEGKVFEAGQGLEDTGVAAAASVADTTATFSLQSPASTTVLVIPIILKVALTNDGSALSQLAVCFTKPAGLCATILTLSGTALTSKHAGYKKNPALTAQQATALYTVTPSALVAADYVEYDRSIAIDAALTTGLPNFGDGPSNVKTYKFLEEGAPHIMSSGAAMLVYVVNSTTDALAKCYMMWAEVTEDDLI
jgi:hypothetical protein